MYPSARESGTGDSDGHAVARPQHHHRRTRGGDAAATIGLISGPAATPPISGVQRQDRKADAESMKLMSHGAARGDAVRVHAADHGSEPADVPPSLTDALLRLLAQQNQSIVTRFACVAELAAGTAINLGLSPSQVALTRLGA